MPGLVAATKRTLLAQFMSLRRARTPRRLSNATFSLATATLCASRRWALRWRYWCSNSRNEPSRFSAEVTPSYLAMAPPRPPHRARDPLKRLVEKKQLSAIHEGAGQRHHLLLPAAQRARPARRPLFKFRHQI